MIGTDSGITGTTGAGSVQQSSAPADSTATPSQETGVASEDTGKTSETPSGKEAAKTKGLFGKAGNTALAGTAKTTPEVPAFTLNPKFKVLDKEMEFDEWAKNSIKDPETEKKVRELYEKAHGLDSVKQDRQTLKNELAETKEKMAGTDRAIEQIGQYAQKKDWDSFFEALRIPKDDILKYALEIVKREQMPPEQRQAWESNRQTQQDAQRYQEQNQQLTTQYQQIQVQQREFQLEMALSKPDITPIVQAYNAGMANPGAFREFVVRMGQAYAANGQDVSVEQAVQEAVKHLRAANPQMGAPLVTAQDAPRVVQPSGKQTLPNIQGRGTSPVKTVVRTLDDLKQRQRELNG